GVDGVGIADELAFAARLTPMLYEKLRGNPRRIKRFLNDLRVRQSIAFRRGIDLDPAVVAKLMVLEKLLEPEFKELLDWLAKGSLRDQLIQLETAAGKSPEVFFGTESAPTESTQQTDGKSSGRRAPKQSAKANPTEATSEFAERYGRVRLVEIFYNRERRHSMLGYYSPL